MSILWKKIEIYKPKSDCETIVIAALGLRQSPAGVLGGKVQNHFCLFNVSRVIRQLTKVLKNYFHSLQSNGLLVKVLDSQSRGPVLKTTGWFQG